MWLASSHKYSQHDEKGKRSKALLQKWHCTTCVQLCCFHLKKTTNHSQPGIAWWTAKKFSLSAIFVDFGGQGKILAIRQKNSTLWPMRWRANFFVIHHKPHGGRAWLMWWRCSYIGSSTVILSLTQFWMKTESVGRRYKNTNIQSGICILPERIRA